MKFEKDVYFKTEQVKEYKSKFTEINSSSWWVINFGILKMETSLK